MGNDLHRGSVGEVGQVAAFASHADEVRALRQEPLMCVLRQEPPVRDLSGDNPRFLDGDLALNRVSEETVAWIQMHRGCHYRFAATWCFHCFNVHDVICQCLIGQ